MDTKIFVKISTLVALIFHTKSRINTNDSYKNLATKARINTKELVEIRVLVAKLFNKNKRPRNHEGTRRNKWEF